MGNRINPEDIEKISNGVSVLDYFLYLEKKGVVIFERKTGHDNYFRTPENKFSVTDDSFYDFKTGEGGKIIKAVMTLENKSWREAVDFLKEFSNIEISSEINAEKEKIKRNQSTHSPSVVTKITEPNNQKLLDYFAERGISKEVLQENTQQVHYKNSGKEYFGIGIKNLSNGYEIRNPYIKAKIGNSDISFLKGSKNEVVVFEGMTDMLSFQQMCKDRNMSNTRHLVVLNSVTNVDIFIDKFKKFNGKIHLILDGDKAGNEATNKILNAFSDKKVVDVRSRYKISENEAQDLNDYLKKYFVKNIDIQKNNSIFVQEKNNSQNGEYTTQSAGISTFEPMGQPKVESNINGIDPTSQSEQETNNPSRQDLDSHNVGNGFGSSEQFNLGAGTGQRTGTNNSTQREISGTTEILSSGQRERSRENISNGNQSRNQRVSETQTLNDEWVTLLDKYKGQKLNNEQIKEIVDKVSFVDEDKTIQLKPNAKNSPYLKDIVSQYKSGGIVKEGRGILDEYYTDEKLVNAIRNLIKDNFKGKSEISILEPSIGTGNFISLTKNLGVKNNITAFEINETTAKISKILNPHIQVNLRSFESEFISDNGLKKEFTPQYDLVIGNPPYGEHRGFYKGLGEETKLSRYEDYFVKRSLDVMKEGAVLAMVLPSGWLNRQKKLNGAELKEAYRLPNGAFKSTDVGTDIVILQKKSQNLSQDVSDYFTEKPSHILGSLTEKTNRFGKLEPYVKGSLTQALHLLETLKNKENIQVKTLFDFIDEAEKNKEEISKEIKTENNKINDKQEIDIVKDKVSEALNNLNFIKIKSLSVITEIEKYQNIKNKLETNPQNFTAEELKEISEKADNIIKIHSKKEKEISEYSVQNSPEIKKKVLKYHFQKEDEVLDARQQNNTNLTPRQIEAFANTDYAGRLQNPEKFPEFANEYLGEFIHDFYYAEGDIYEKLEVLENRHWEGKIETPQYEKQKALLESVLPPKKALEDIIISPNHEFIHQFKFGEEEREVKKQTGWAFGRTMQPTYTTQKEMVEVTLADKFKGFINNLPREAFGNSSSWEVRSFVDNEQVTGSDKDRNALVRERRKEVANDLFNKFLREELSDTEKERFVNEFNRKYNNIHIPNYKNFPLFSGIHKNFKGRPLNLTEVQKAGIGRLTTKGVGLLAHEVGFGKTLSGILAMHEAMERGNAKRPLIVVPNDSILKQWVETIFETIPNAKVNVLGNLGKDYDLSKFENKDKEITLVTYEGFNNIGFSQETTERLASRFSYISENETKSLKYTERDIQKELQKQEEVQGKMKRGKLYDWEDFGFDHLTFDEVHNANHIIGKVRIEDKKYASDFRSQNQATSLLGINTWMAAQYIQEQNNGRNVTLLSATPFTNKPLEYYSVLSLIANERLEKSGYFNVNTFFETFMEADNDMEIDAKGDIKYKTNVRRFKNNALFQQLLGEFIDIKGEEDNPELKRPNRINKEYKIEQNELTKNMYARLNDSFDEEEKGAILTHILNARKIAISPYLSQDYDGDIPTTKEFVENSPKLKTTMDLIAQNKADKPEVGQIIYSELGVSEFPKLKEYLISEVGYKTDEVAIITGAVNKNQRLDIQEKFNEGKIKIVIGSEAIQEGMNLQKNTSDMYLLSLPYNFTSLRQTEGRAWRQGNQWENVRINFMLTNDSIDVFMLQKLQAKQARYMEAIKKGANVIDVSDVDTQELKTALITDPITRAEIEISVIKKRLENEKTRHEADLGFVSRKFEKYVKSDEYKAVKVLKEDLEKYTQWVESGNKHWENQVKWTKDKLSEALPKLYQLENNLLEKGIDIKDFQMQKEQTENKISEIKTTIENKLPLIKENLIKKYETEKQEKLKNYNPTDFVSERAEENKTFFKLGSSNDKLEKIAEKEKSVLEQQENNPRGFRR